MEVYDSPGRRALQTSWLRKLVQDGKVAQLEALDPKHKSELDYNASMFMRTLELISSTKDSAEELIVAEGKSELRELITRYIQIRKVNMEELKSLPGFENAEDVRQKLEGLLSESFTLLKEGLGKLKDQTIPTFNKFKDILDLVDPWDQAGLCLFRN